MKEKGMTLVSVIVAFAILMIGIAMFYSSIQLSNNIVSTQKERIENTEKLVNQYYLEDNHAKPIEKKLNVVGLDGFNEIEITKYTITNSAGELHYYGK